jgi:glyoxylase-like metal-dependent hydrolase (beta-lactamase superfamily II)
MSSTTQRPVVRSFHHAATGTWTHVVVDPATRHAAIIDAVLDFDLSSGQISSASVSRVLEYVATAGLKVDWILETHAHADHLSAGAWLRERTKAQLAIGTGIVEVQRTFKRLLDLGEDFATDGSQFDRLFADGDAFKIGELGAQIIATPGHTSDSVTYAIGDAIFVGDTVFAPPAGTARCDFPGGDAAKLCASIRKLYELDDTTRLFLCHDYPASDAAPVAETTIAAQKAANAHLCASTTESDYIALRVQRDRTLAIPKLLWPAIQFNIRGGRPPPANENGRVFFKLPVAFDAAP